MQGSGAPMSPAVPDQLEELLDEGRSLVAEGALDDAVAALTRANRLRRDPLVERQLLELRHRAATCEDAPADPAWPPTLPDPFPQVTGLPVIGPGGMDAARVGGAILHHGAIIVRGLARPDEADELRTVIEGALAACAAPDGADPDGLWHASDAWDVDQDELLFARRYTEGTGGLLAVDSPRAFFLLLEVYERAGLLEVLERHLGRRPLLSVMKTTFRRVQHPGGTWHQDGSFMGEVRTVNCWLSLSHCGRGTDGIGLDVVPARLHDILDTHRAGDVNLATIQSEALEASHAGRTTSPTFAPGDALLFDERFVHRTGTDPSRTAPRYAVESWFYDPRGFHRPYGPLAV